MATNAPKVSIDEYFQSDSETSAAELQDESNLERASSYGGNGKLDPTERAQILRDLAPIPGGGELLEQRNPVKIMKAIERGIESQDRLRKNREEQGKHWDLVAGGCQFSFLEKSEDQSVYKQLFPDGVSQTPLPIPNKVADLKKKIISQVLVDKWLPDPKPDGANSDRNRGACDLLKKMLRANATATQLDEAGMANECLNINMAHKSAFVWFWIDDMGGGWRPMQKLAHPRAEDANNPLVATKLGPDGQPIMVPDGDSGMLKPITEHTTTPVLRYVTEDGTFTTNPSEAARQWMPKMRRRVLRPTQVVCLPSTEPVTTAPQITMLLWESLGEAKNRFPILKTLDNGQLRQLCAWRPPKRWKALVPEAVRPRGGEVVVGSDGVVSDTNLIFWYHHYCRISGNYMDGAEIAIMGGINNAFLLRRTTLREDVETEEGTTVPILMDPPVAQFKCYNDIEGGDPFGRAGLEDFGGSYELYAHLYTAILEAVDKGVHPNVYIPSTSPVTRQEYLRRDGTPINIQHPDDKPTTEDTPGVPNIAMNVLDKLEMGMNSAAGLNETAMGLDSQYSESGIAKDVAIRQAKVSLMQLWENTSSGFQQCWKIQHQLGMARLTVPQEVMLSGVESAYKQRWFVGSDLLGVREIPPAAGSGSMQSPMEKIQLLRMMQDGGWIEKEEAAELARTTMTDNLGLQPNTHEESIDRQIGAFIDGPPPDWLEQYRQNEEARQQYQAATQQQVAALVSEGFDQQTATQQVQQMVPPPQLIPLFNPFEPRPNDAEPGVAKIRAVKLSRMISSPDFEKQEPEWQQLAVQAYQKAFYDAGGQTVEQQAQAAQAQNQKGDDASFAQFRAEIDKLVLGKIRAELAKIVAGEVGAGPQPEAGADPNVEMAARAHEAEVGARTTLANDAAKREHESRENALDRQHESQENALDRSQSAQQTMVKTALDARMKSQQLAEKQRERSLARQALPTPVG